MEYLLYAILPWKLSVLSFEFKFESKVFNYYLSQNVQLSNRDSRYLPFNFFSKLIVCTARKILYHKEAVFGNPISCIPWSTEWFVIQPLNSFTAKDTCITLSLKALFINTMGFIVAGSSNMITPVLKGGIFSWAHFPISIFFFFRYWP